MPVTFRVLPREIRDAIYNECLIFDGEIVPFPYAQEPKLWELVEGVEVESKQILDLQYGEEGTTDEEKQLATGLLTMDHDIAEEAAEVFFSCNNFRLSRVTGDQTTRFWSKYRDLFKRVVITLSPQDVEEEEILRKLSPEWRAKHLVGLVRPKRQYKNSTPSFCEVDREGILTEVFTRKVAILQEMNLKTLVIGHAVRTCGSTILDNDCGCGDTTFALGDLIKLLGYAFFEEDLSLAQNPPPITVMTLALWTAEEKQQFHSRGKLGPQTFWLGKSLPPSADPYRMPLFQPAPGQLWRRQRFVIEYCQY